MKRPHLCTICEEQVRDIKSRHTKGPLKGEAIEFEGWRDNAWRVAYEMSDGTVCDITLCEKCLGGNMTEIWAKCVERFLWEEKVREHRNVAPRTPLQQERAEEELNRVLELSLVKEVGRRMWKYVGHEIGILN